MDEKCRSKYVFQLHQDLENAIAVVDAVKARISKLAPVARLPDELLSEIFSVLADTQMSSWDLVRHVFVKRRRRPSRLGWMLVTHICREWRRVAFGTPALWRRITFSLGTQLAKRMLMHARHAPLSIIVRPMSLPFAPEVAYRISSRLYQTRTLDFAASKSALTQLVGSLMKSPLLGKTDDLTGTAPALQFLSLASQSENYFSSVCDVVYIPVSILRGSAPELHHISLRNVFISWNAYLLRDLHTLSIVLPVFERALDTDPEQPAEIISKRKWQPEVIQLMKILQRMPDLESLTIHGALPYSDDDILDADPRFVPGVQMPRLSHLDLKGSVEGTALMLSILRLPLDVDMRLASYYGEKEGDVNISTLFKKIARHFTIPSNKDPSIYLYFTDLQITNYFPSITFRGRVQRKVSKSTTLDVQLMDITFHDSEHTTLKELFQAIEIHALESLGIANFKHDDIRATDWGDFIGQCNRGGIPHEDDIPIRYVRIDGTTLEAFCRFLGFGVPERHPNGHIQTPRNLPKLRTLVIYSLSAPMVTSVKAEVIDVLRRRRDVSVPLDRLIFERCPPGAISDDFLDRLKAIVPEVVVQDSIKNWSSER